MTDTETAQKRRPWIVCAACRDPKTGFIAAGPRHFDDTMHKQVDAYFKAGNGDWSDVGWWEQGFIDQYGRFYGRTQAAQIVKDNKQPFDLERNGRNGSVLFSEGLY